MIPYGRQAVPVFLIAVLLGIPMSGAGESPVSVEASVDRADALIGDPIRYAVTVRHPPGVMVEWPAFTDAAGDWTVEASGAEGLRMDHGTAVETRWYELASYSAGTHTIPETVVRYRVGDGASDEARTQAITVTVRGLLPADWERQDIRPVKPLIPVHAARWWLWGGLALLAGAVGAWWRSRHQRRMDAPPVPPRPPHDIALDALARLREEDLPSRRRYEEYYVRLSGIIRAYIEARFGVRAPEMTTEEFLQAASNAAALSLNHRQLLQVFLERSDLVKFARYEPSQHEADEALEAAQRFVQDTAPSLEPPAASPRMVR